MAPSDSIIDFIKDQEGFVPHAYRDIANVLTIGYGSTVYITGARPVMGDTITPEKAHEIVLWEAGNKGAALNGFVKGLNLTQNQFDACLDFIYNLGVGAFAGSTLLRRIRHDKNDPAIRDAFMMWNKAKVNGQLVVVEGLTARRKKEADLYFKA